MGYEGPGVSAAGALAGGATYMLGECQLNDVPKEERFPLMSGLVAAALPVASPSGAALLALLTIWPFLLWLYVLWPYSLWQFRLISIRLCKLR